MNRSHLIAVFVVLVALPSLASGNGALVKVVLGKASAPASTALPVGTRFSTGNKSQSQVAVDDGVVRTGSNTTIRVLGKDEVMLDSGLALVSSKPRFFRRSLSVQTPGHKLKVRGTAQVYYDPGRSIRVVVIEGRMTVSLNSLKRESVILEAGQVLLINPAAPTLPEPLEIDLNRLVSTAQLLSERLEPLPSSDLVREASQRQASERETVSREAFSSSRDVDEPGGEVSERPEEIVHEEVAGEIPDLDGDGEPDAEFLLNDEGDGADATDGDGNDDQASEDGTPATGDGEG